MPEPSANLQEYIPSRGRRILQFTGIPQITYDQYAEVEGRYFSEYFYRGHTKQSIGEMLALAYWSEQWAARNPTLLTLASMHYQFAYELIRKHLIDWGAPESE